MKTTQHLLTFAAVALLAMPAHAWWFSKDDKTAQPGQGQAQRPGQGQQAVRRYHLSIPDKKTEQELLSMFDSRRKLTEDVRIMERVTEERKGEYNRITRVLMDEFGILPENKYYYDNASMTVFLIAPAVRTVEPDKKTAAAGSDGSAEAPAQLERKEHRKLKSKEEEKQFMDLITRKKQLHDQLQAFQGVMAEKQWALKNVTDLMGAKFSMKSGFYYDYDQKNMKLYEVGAAEATPAAAPQQNAPRPGTNRRQAP